jgi:hypothetical protein
MYDRDDPIIGNLIRETNTSQKGKEAMLNVHDYKGDDLVM